MGSRFKLATLCLTLTAALLTTNCWAQGMSRWRLGRPALIIDLPGDPSGSTVPWTDRAGFSVFPNAWVAEGNGAKVEVARIYTQQSPQELLAEIGRKLGELAVGSTGWVSGRPFANGLVGDRAVLVFGAEPGVGSSPAWAVVTTPQNAAGRATAGKVLDSIVLERAGRPLWALRSLGRSNIVAELPFELAPTSKLAADNQRVYEAHFNNMSIEVSVQPLDPNGRYDTEKSARSAIQDAASRPGTKIVSSKVEKIHLNDKKRPGHLLEMTLTEGSRNYKLWKIYTTVEQNGMIITFTTDPGRTEHHNVVARVLGKLRYSNAVIHGWQTYPAGDGGLFLDLPKAPEPVKKSGTMATTAVFTGPMAVDVREIQYEQPPANLDASAAQLLTFMQAHPDHKNVKGAVEKRVVDGLEARLIRTTHRRGSQTNHRHMLVIYGDDRQYVVDAIAGENEKDYLDRIVDSASVNMPTPQTLLRQYVGQMGVSFVAGDQRLKTEVSENPIPGITRMEQTLMQFDTGRALVNEQVHLQPMASVTAQEATTLLTTMFGQVAGSTIRVHEALPINVDGIGGIHVRFDHIREGRTERGDFVILNREKYLWMMTLFTDPELPLQRKVRMIALNSLRATQ